MDVRAPDFPLDEGPLLWSKIPEFAIAYNGYSVVIPYVEYYLNSIMNKVRSEHCADKPELREELGTFIRQEINHSRYHVRFNQRMFDEGIDGLKPLVERVTADLKQLRETRSLAFNVAYCAGFESIATFDAIRLHTVCDDLFEDAEAGANLMLWHVAEEFEHRAVCHDAFKAVSGNYFLRIYGLVYAFRHIGSAFLESERYVFEHYTRHLDPEQRKAAQQRQKKLFWRQIRFLAPRMLQIFLPFYNPAQVREPARIGAALRFFGDKAPIHSRPEMNTAQTA